MKNVGNLLSKFFSLIILIFFITNVSATGIPDLNSNPSIKNPKIEIFPIDDQYCGKSFFINGTTDFPAGKVIIVSIISSLRTTRPMVFPNNTFHEGWFSKEAIVKRGSNEQNLWSIFVNNTKNWTPQKYLVSVGSADEVSESNIGFNLYIGKIEIDSIKNICLNNTIEFSGTSTLPAGREIEISFKKLSAEDNKNNSPEIILFSDFVKIRTIEDKNKKSWFYFLNKSSFISGNYTIIVSDANIGTNKISNFNNGNVAKSDEKDFFLNNFCSDQNLTLTENFNQKKSFLEMIFGFLKNFSITNKINFYDSSRA